MCPVTIQWPGICRTIQEMFGTFPGILPFSYGVLTCSHKFLSLSYDLLIIFAYGSAVKMRKSHPGSEVFLTVCKLNLWKNNENKRKLRKNPRHLGSKCLIRYVRYMFLLDCGAVYWTNPLLGSYSSEGYQKVFRADIVFLPRDVLILLTQYSSAVL